MKPCSVSFAEYGNKDFLGCVREMVKKGATYILASNSVFGDPCPKSKKFLELRWEIGGTLLKDRCEEGEYIFVSPSFRLARADLSGVDVTDRVKDFMRRRQRITTELLDAPTKSLSLFFEDKSTICCTPEDSILFLTKNKPHCSPKRKIMPEKQLAHGPLSMDDSKTNPWFDQELLAHLVHPITRTVKIPLPAIPITNDIKKGPLTSLPNGKMTIRLSVDQDTEFMDQVAYQLAHEMCHAIAITYEQQRGREAFCELYALHFWIEEIVCEAASQYVLEMGNFQEYLYLLQMDNPGLEECKISLLELTAVPTDDQRLKYGAIAQALLPYLVEHPFAWNALAYIRAGNLHKGSITDFLKEWLKASESDSDAKFVRHFIAVIATLPEAPDPLVALAQI